MAAPVISPHTLTPYEDHIERLLYYQHQRNTFQRKTYCLEYHGQHHQSGQRNARGTDSGQQAGQTTITCCPMVKSMPYT